MKELLWLIPTSPFAGALILVLAGSKLPRSVAALIGAGSVGLSALITILAGIDFLSTSPAATSFDQVEWAWISIGAFTPNFAFHLDALSLVFIFVITFVGFLIHIYSVEFMMEDDGVEPFFAYLNLFASSLLILGLP